jgi:hypothetical protein
MTATRPWGIVRLRTELANHRREERGCGKRRERFAVLGEEYQEVDRGEGQIIGVGKLD